MLVADFEGNLKITAEGDSLQAPFEAPAETDEPIAEDSIQFTSFEVLPSAPAPENQVPTEDWGGMATQQHAEPQSVIVPIDMPVNMPSQILNPEIQEVNDFANSNAALATEGVLSYDLKIEGIDDIEIKNSVRDFIDDPRLKLDVKKIMATVENGNLVIKNLNPVKTSIIINRIKEIPVQISWTQKSTLTSVPKIK